MGARKPKSGSKGPKGGRKGRMGAKGQGASKSRASARPIPPNQKWGVYAAVVVLAAMGWAVGRYGLVSWILTVFVSAAGFGFWYPGLLKRVVDQHKNLARQVGDASWDEVGRMPVADVAAAVLLGVWIVFLAAGLGRYPFPELLRSCIGALCAVLGLTVRAAVTAYRKGTPAGPYTHDLLDRSVKALGGKGVDRGRRGTAALGVVVVQAAVGQVMLGGSFGQVWIDPVTDLWVGSGLLGAAGAELVILLIRHRLLPVADRVATLKQAIRP